MRRALLPLLLVIAGACRSKPAVTRDPESRDATPREDAGPKPTKDERVVFHNKVIDLAGSSILHTFGPDVPKLETHDGKRALVFGKDSVLRAYDLADGHERWKVTPKAPCVGIGFGAKIAFCANATEVLVIEDPSGTARTIAPSTTSPVREGQTIGSSFVIRHDDGTLDAFDASSGVLFATISKLGVVPIGFRPSFLMPNRETFCLVGYRGRDFEITCWDARLVPKWTKTVVMHKPTDPPSASFWPRQRGPNYLVLSSSYSSIVRRAVVIRLSDGLEVARVEDEIASTVERPDGLLEGLLASTPDVRLLETSGAVRWTSPKIPKATGGVAVSRDDRVFIATYESMATGAGIYGVDRKSGTLLWQGDHEQLMIAHSIYINEIWLSMVGENVVMHGEEASMSYIQIFGARDGKRIFSDTRYTF